MKSPPTFSLPTPENRASEGGPIFVCVRVCVCVVSLPPFLRFSLSSPPALAPIPQRKEPGGFRLKCVFYLNHHHPVPSRTKNQTPSIQNGRKTPFLSSALPVCYFAPFQPKYESRTSPILSKGKGRGGPLTAAALPQPRRKHKHKQKHGWLALLRRRRRG